LGLFSLCLRLIKLSHTAGNGASCFTTSNPFVLPPVLIYQQYALYRYVLFCAGISCIFCVFLSTTIISREGVQVKLYYCYKCQRFHNLFGLLITITPEQASRSVTNPRLTGKATSPAIARRLPFETRLAVLPTHRVDTQPPSQRYLPCPRFHDEDSSIGQSGNGRRTD
jgi:hypothetical protein